MTLALPQDYKLPIHLLASSFNNISATYKFYWFLALLEEVKHGQTKINKQHLFARMIAGAWYTVNYFHISFGKQDQLQRAIQEIALVLTSCTKLGSAPPKKFCQVEATSINKL